MKKTTDKQRLERLKELHYILSNYDELFEMKFDMGTWAEKDFSCGSAACALGTAACWPNFKKQGLGLIPLFTRAQDGATEFNPIYGHLEGREAGEYFFGISRLESKALFSLSYYSYQKTLPIHVAERVKNLIDFYEGRLDV
jgi:hypothetical protein